MSDLYPLYHGAFLLSVLTPYEFSICDTSGPEFGEYQHGGVISQVKLTKTNHFVSLHYIASVYFTKK